MLPAPNGTSSPFGLASLAGTASVFAPYYLTHKAQETGYNPEMILAGRRINDNMGIYVVSQVIKLMLQKQILVKGARILILGLHLQRKLPGCA